MQSLIKKATQHFSNHKHRYALGTFGSFAIVKMALLFAGFLGISQLVNVFATYTPVTVDMPDGTYLKRVIPKTGEVDITNPDQAANLQNWFDKGVLSLTVVKNHQLTFFSLASVDTFLKFTEATYRSYLETWGGDSQVIIDFRENQINSELYTTERNTAATYIQDLISNGGTYTNPYTGSSLATTDLSDYQEFFTKYPLLKLGSDTFILPHLTSWTSHPIDADMITRFLDIGYIANLGNITTSSSTPFILAGIETYLKRAEAAAGSTVSVAGGNANFSPNQQHYLLQYFEGLHFDTPLQLQTFMEKGFVTNIGVKDDQEMSFGMLGVVFACVDSYLKWTEVLAIYNNNPIYGLGTDAFATNASGNFTNVFLNAGRNILQLGSVDITPAGINHILDMGSVVSFGYITENNIFQPYGIATIDTYLKLAEAIGLTTTPASAGDGVAITSLTDQGLIGLSADQQKYINQYIGNINIMNSSTYEAFYRMLDKGFVTNIGERENQDITFGTPSVIFAGVETYLKFAEAIGLAASSAVPASTDSGVAVTASAFNGSLSSKIFSLGNDNFATDASGNVSNIFLNAGKNLLQLGSHMLTLEDINRILDKGSVISFGYKYGRTIYPYGIASVETYLKLTEAILYNSAAPASITGDGVAITSLVDDGLIGISDQQQKYISQYLNNIAYEGSTHLEIFDRIMDKGFITNIGYRNSQNITFGVPSVIFASVETYLKFADAAGLTRDYRYINLFYPLGTDTFATDTSGNFTNVLLNAGRSILQLGSQTLTPEELDYIIDRGNVVSFGYIYNGYTHPYGIASVETYLKLCEAIGYTIHAAPAGAGDGIAIASILDNGFLGLSPNQQKYISQYLDNITPNNTSTNNDIFENIMGKGFITNFGVKDNQEVSFGIPGVVMASVENYLKLAEDVGITYTNYNYSSNHIYSLGTNAFAIDASGNFQNPFLNTSRRILQLGSTPITPEKLDGLLDYGNVVSFGYIIGTQIQPYSFSSVETYLKLADAIGLNYRAQAVSLSSGVAITSIVDQGLIGLSNDQIHYINQYLNSMHSIDTATDLEVRDTLNTQGFVINIGIKDNKEVSFGIPGVVMASIETYLKFTGAIGLSAQAAAPASVSSGVAIAALNNALGNNIFSLGNGNFAMDASGNVANIFLNAGKKLLKLGDTEVFTTTGSMTLFLMKGSVVSFGYIIGTHIQPWAIAGVETYLKLAEAIGLNTQTAAPASVSSDVAIASLIDQGPIGISLDQQKYIGQYINTIVPITSTLPEMWDRIMDKGFVMNFGIKDNQEVSFGIPGVVMASIETYLKFAEAIGLTAPAAPASTDSGVGITAINPTNSIFSLGNGNFTTDASGNVSNIFLNAGRNLLQLGSRSLSEAAFDRIMDKGSVVSFGYRYGRYLHPWSISSIESFLKLAEAIGLTAPASTGDGVAITSLGDNGLIGLSDDQQKYIGKYLGNIIPNTSTLPEMWDRFMDKGFVTNIGVKDDQEIIFGTPSVVFASIETYLKFAEAVGLTINDGSYSNIYPSGTGDFMPDASGNLQDPFLNAPITILNLNTQGINAETLDRILDRGIVVSHGWKSPNNTAIPNGIASVETYDKIHGAMFEYGSTPHSLQFMISLSPDQQQYINQYINNITSTTMSQAEIIDRILDKGIITNIGYTNKDISIGIPGFILSNADEYLQLMENIDPSIIFTLGDNHFSMDGSGTMRQPLLDVPLSLFKRSATIGWDPMDVLFDYLLTNGIVVSFGAPEGTHLSMPVFLGYIAPYLSLANDLSFDIPSLPMLLTHDNSFTLAQAQHLATQFTHGINATNYTNFKNFLNLFIGGIVIDTFADRGSSNTEPTTWDLNIFSDMLNGNYLGLESIGLPLPFINPGTGDDILLMTPAFYFNNYYNNNSGLLTYNRFTNADLGGTIPIYPQHQIFYAMKTCGDGTQQTPNNNGVNEYCDEGTLNGQAGHCNASCTAVIAPSTPSGGGGGSAGGLTTTATTHGSTTGSTFSSELIDAYTRAFGLHITTLPKSQAGLDLPSLRAHIAKMMVEYVKNILKKVPDTTKKCSFTDVAKQTPELQGYITEACQLGLMGQSITAFRPNDSLTRAEFVTLLARALYGDTYNNSTPYYAKSMAKLFADKVIKDTNPKLIEIKAYILLMLMRSTTGK